MKTIRNTAPEVLRLVTRVASLYHERGLSQSSIAEQLGLSQARVSRLLKQAEQLGIVKTTVHVPEGVHADIEEQVEARYGIDECIVVEIGDDWLDDDDAVAQALASSTAAYLELLLPTLSSVAVSSWSSSLLAAVNLMRPTNAGVTDHIIQAIGGIGHAHAQRFATRLTERLAELVHAEPTFMMAPGVAASADAKRAIETDASCQQVLNMLDDISGILLGIGSLPPSKMLRDSGNVLSDQDLDELKTAGAVGDVCMRFFDTQGQLVQTSFHDRIIGIQPNQILQARRRIGVAGGTRKFDAIQGALRGGWLSTLITDLSTAQRLLKPS